MRAPAPRRASRPGLLLVAIAFALVSTLGCDDQSGGEFAEGTAPDIATDVSGLSFSVVSIGQHSDQVFILQNRGNAPLTVSDMLVSGAGAEAFTVYLTPGAPYAGEDFQLAERGEDAAEIEVMVRYAPSGVGGADAILTLYSNDRDDPEYRLTLKALENGPRPQVVPNPVVFGQVPGGAVAYQNVTVANVGSAPLRFARIFITGSPDFDVETPDRGAIPFPDDPLEPSQDFQFRIVYSPPEIGPDAGQLVVEYYFSTSDIRTYTADISANGAEPCIRVTPQDFIDFGQALVGDIHWLPATLENCGDDTLIVTSIRTADTSDEAFGLDQLPAELETGTLELAAGDGRQFQVGFVPVNEQAYQGTLIIESDAPGREEITLDLRGIGTLNQCPTAVAGGRVRGSGAPFSDQVTAEPNDYLELDGSGSSDPDGNAVDTYRWSIVSAPAGLSVAFTPSTTDPAKTAIELPQIGDYVFELIVLDEHGRESCNAARVEVRVRTERQFLIELSWRTPSDFDETDDVGTDIDLHLLRPGGLWNSPSGGDCYYLAKDPGWGSAATTDDDPHLDRDDTDGGGPEQINIKVPARTDGTGGAGGYTAPYQVGVYFYDNWGFAPPVFAQLKVFLNGASAPTMILPNNATHEMRLNSSGGLFSGGDFWHVGYLDWTATGGNFRESSNPGPRSGFP